jgi:hypothetical protein
MVTVDQLVTWDGTHGRHLFDWNDESAAYHHRLQQARMFLNSFRAKFEGKRVRAFIRIHPDENVDVAESTYINIAVIAKHDGMRAQVINDIRKRMASLASELKMWRLTNEEQEELFERLAEAMNGADEEPVARRHKIPEHAPAPAQ